MKRYGEDFTLKQDLMDIIATYMDDDERERLHNRIAPCEPAEFLEEYCAACPDFTSLLDQEFGITFDDEEV